MPRIEAAGDPQYGKQHPFRQLVCTEGKNEMPEGSLAEDEQDRRRFEQPVGGGKDEPGQDVRMGDP